MKLRTTTPASTLSRVMRIGIIVTIAVTAITLPAQVLMNHPVSADAYDAKIQVLRQKIASYEDDASALRKKADTLQNAVNQLSNQKSKIQAEIDLRQVEYNKLVKEIKDTETRIKENRRTSGDLIVKSSLSEDIPLIVRLAASENLADYIDGEVSRISVRDTIVQKTEENEKLKIQLKEKQAAVKRVLDDQKAKRNELADKEAEQQKLLNDTKGNEAEYNKLIRGTNAEIRKVQAEQQAAYERARAAWASTGGTYITRGGSGGGYRWANAYWNYNIGYSTVVDDWGLYARQCVSYVAWKLDSKGYGVKHFGSRGNAGDWPSTTSGYTSQTTGVPHVGDAAIIPYSGNFPYGHVMYVESINGDGSINISEYNFAGPGIYSERNIPRSTYAGYIFITFPKR